MPFLLPTKNNYRFTMVLASMFRKTPANIKFMRQFYECWRDDLKSLTAVSGIGDDKSLTPITYLIIRARSLTISYRKYPMHDNH